ncbi:MAG TPA: hypothetical protein PK867_07405, partial [Pirellulales bacterium]|nr:hypothetical protein [Pirellulales bacterium]
DLFLFLSAALPPLLAVMVSLVDLPIFHSHYLVFAHLFLLAALARLLARLPFLFERILLAGLVVNFFISADVALLRRLDFGDRPGVRGAVALIERARKHGEPVVVTSPYYYLPTVYHLRDRENCHLLKENCRLTHYEGTAALDDADYVRSADLGSLTGGRAWAINADSPGSWGRTSLPAPRTWLPLASWRFREPYYVQGTVEVVEYRLRGTSGEVKETSP